MRLGKGRKRCGVGSVAQSEASFVQLAGSEQRRAGGPRHTVSRRGVGAELRTERDQLSEVGDGLDAADLGDPDEPVRVEIIAEQERGVLVGRIEEPRLAVVHEVALVDRLEPQRVGLPPEG